MSTGVKEQVCALLLQIMQGVFLASVSCHVFLISAELLLEETIVPRDNCPRSSAFEMYARLVSMIIEGPLF